MGVKNKSEIIATHVSTTKDVPLRERLSARVELDDMMGRLLRDDVHAAMHDDYACREPVDTLDEFLSLNTVPKLRRLLEDAGYEDVPKGPKRHLVEMLLGMWTNGDPHQYQEHAAIIGEDYVRDLRSLLAEGGRREYRKDDVRYMDDIMAPNLPLVAYFETGYAYVAFVPREVRSVLERLNDGDWEPYVQLARTYDGLRSYVRATTDLRGITPLAPVVHEYLEGHPSDIDPDMLESMLTDGVLLDDTSAEVIKNTEDDATYLTASSLVDLLVDDGRGVVDSDLIEDVLVDQQRLPPRAPSESHVAGDEVRFAVLETPEGRDLIALLDEHVPKGYSDESFALDIMEELTYDLRLTDDLRCLCRCLAAQDLKVVGDFARQLFSLAERFNRVVPKWRLNGWSYAELADQARDDSSLMALEPEPTVLPDFDLDDVGGFTWPTDEDIAGGIWSTSADGGGSLVGEQPGEGDGPEEVDRGGASDGTGASKERVVPGEDDADEYERKVERLHREVDRHLTNFEAWLEDSGLKRKTVDKHIRNVQPFIEYYLADYLGIEAEQGVAHVGGYLGEFFVRKMLWSTPASIKTTAASIKKFYKYMEAYGYIDRPDLDYVLEDIKDGLPLWCETCEVYNDPDADNPFDFW